jgi:cellulose synthase/poly-beta-1,6-N-acetylglucosamine synthase-like glycosyltransferase
MINLFKTYWHVITALLMVVIAITSLWPADMLPKVPGTDKTHHFIAYTALMLPTALYKTKHRLIIAFGFFVFSGIIELIQPLVNRYGEWLDLLANGAGLFCGFILAWLLNFIFGTKIMKSDTNSAD